MSGAAPPDEPGFLADEPASPPDGRHAPRHHRGSSDDTFTTTCSACGATERRPIGPGEFGGALLVQVRTEMREALLFDAPANLQEPPHCDVTERSLAAAALAGFWSPNDHVVKKEHFLSPFLGAVWETTRALFPRSKRPVLEQVAAKLEQQRVCRAEVALTHLTALAGPGEYAANNELLIDKLLRLSMQRDLLLDAMALTRVIQVGASAEEIGTRLRAMRDKLLAAKPDATGLLGRMVAP